MESVDGKKQNGACLGSGYRKPTINASVFPNIPSEMFPDTPASESKILFWSTTPDEEDFWDKDKNKDSIWSVDFNTGVNELRSGRYSPLFLRLVRDK